MRTLAVENIDRPIVQWPRRQEHEVAEVAVVAAEAADEDLIAISRSEKLILMTFDRDIGRLIQGDSQPHPGVVYLRLRGAGQQLWDAFARNRAAMSRSMAEPRASATARHRAQSIGAFAAATRP